MRPPGASPSSVVSSQDPSPLVEHVGRAFLVRGAVAERDRLEPVLLVELARGLVGLEGEKAQTTAASLDVIEEPETDTPALHLRLHVELVERVAAQHRDADDTAVELRHPDLVLDEHDR